MSRGWNAGDAARARAREIGGICARGRNFAALITSQRPHMHVGVHAATELAATRGGRKGHGHVPRVTTKDGTDETAAWPKSHAYAFTSNPEAINPHVHDYPDVVASQVRRRAAAFMATAERRSMLASINGCLRWA